MKRKYILIFIASFLVISLFPTYGYLSSERPKLDERDFYVGIDVGYDNVDEVKRLIDEVSRTLTSSCWEAQVSFITTPN